jgi:hypothetical protein
LAEKSREKVQDVLETPPGLFAKVENQPELSDKDGGGNDGTSNV